MACFCFVSYEIHPATPGGCGVLLYQTAYVLLNQGHRVIFLLDIPEKVFNQFTKNDRLALPNFQNCVCYHVETLASGLNLSENNFRSLFEYRSYRFHITASRVNLLEHPDIIEFVEYCGIAYHALSAKVAGLDYKDTKILLRLHTSLELIDREQPSYKHSLDRFIMYDLEHQALRFAEGVLYPSKSYLDKAYAPYYEKWFGQTFFSKPPLVDGPRLEHAVENKDIILFYSRLGGIKGVDRFVDAALLYLSNPNNPQLNFYLVGFDSFSPPGDLRSYQEYLERKIPRKYRDYFQFTGFLTWQALERLLPRVLMAVFPSYFESFCYAAHELYSAGVPIIVSKIPAFEDYFRDEINALVFDGSVSDLAWQMIRLSQDEKLRRNITLPYRLHQNTLDSFYSTLPGESWIAPRENNLNLALLICIICDNPADKKITLASLDPIPDKSKRVLLLNPYNEEREERVAAWFLGKLYTFEDRDGNEIYPIEIFTADALLFLRAGDILDKRYVEIGLDILQRQEQISYVGCWKRVVNGESEYIETFPVDAASELLPFLESGSSSRIIFRTKPANLLIDLFDPRTEELGELAHIWEIDNENTCGVVIPEILLSYRQHSVEFGVEAKSLDYLIIRDHNTWRKSRLTRYLLTLPDRSELALEQPFNTPKHKLSDNANMDNSPNPVLVDKIKASRLGYLGTKIPWMKRIGKFVVDAYLRKRASKLP